MIFKMIHHRLNFGARTGFLQGNMQIRQPLIYAMHGRFILIHVAIHFALSWGCCKLAALSDRRQA
jgi:hypothetical protein